MSFKSFYKKLAITLTIVFAFGIVISKVVLASDFELELTNEYKEWEKMSEEEKENSIMPKTFSFNVPDNILEEEKQNSIPDLVGSLKPKSKINLENVSASSSDSVYNLANDLNIRVENQGITNECWAFSVLKSMETNIALESGVTELRDFSERHMDYSLIKTFTDGTNPNALNREAGDGGLPIMGLAYLTNGSGAVLEEDMPFENNMDVISLESLNKDVDTIVTDYQLLPTINKKYTKDSKGNTILVEYTDSNGNPYTDEEVKAIRNIIKQYIIDNGAIASFTAGSKSEYYNTSNIFDATAYNCNNTSVIRDHAITIVGWDDNYSKDNFKEGTKPSTDGAYIALNTYGEENFDSGYIYISYEDFFIESELYGVCGTSEVDYDKIYQYDYFGGILKLGTTGSKVGYFGNTFDRNINEEEVLNSVGVTLCDYSRVEIYVNPEGSDLKLNNLIKVGDSGVTLEPGYHRIDITPTNLTGDSFGIVIKQTSTEDFSFEIEAAVENTNYDSITSEHRSYISLDGSTWTNLSALSVGGVNMSTADVCIKAFTSAEPNHQEPEEDGNINSDLYLIEDGYIMNIRYSTTREEFLSNINTDLEYKIINKDGSEFLDSEEIIQTGMKLRLSNNTEYNLIIRGDANCDGVLTLTDFSKLLLHYLEKRGYVLTGDAAKACDMNLDGKMSLTDVSQMIVLYTSI